MKFSEQWLREWANPNVDTDTLAQQITMAGLEVDGIERVARPFSGIVVGEVASIGPHPDADKLRVCSVTDGKTYFQVVCGAPNVTAGMRAPFARLGAKLSSGMEIKKVKLRGVESVGMLCSEEELGLAEKSEGLMQLAKDAPLGMDVRALLSLDDTIIDVDLTPNRSDCLSILGIAREVSTINSCALDQPQLEAAKPLCDDIFPIKISAPDACPRYVGRVIRNVNLASKTPFWMSEKLRRSGIRSIDPVVDVTNYVMLELGQPLHAFDLAELDKHIDVRYAEPNEKLILLDGQEIQLRSDTLLIADAAKPLALAGIMGGEHSGVSLTTRNIFLEGAFFSPLAIAGKARSYGLHTESSHRFERGVDSCHQTRAIERATELLLSIVGGEPGPTSEVESKNHLPATRFVELRHHKVEELLGIRLGRTQVEELLVRLALSVHKVTKEGWLFEVPSHRFDIAIEADLIEEVARIYGYNSLPVTEPLATMSMPSIPEGKASLRKTKQVLVDMAYQEAITYSFTDQNLQKLIEPELVAIELANPIASDMAVMRTSLWPGLLKTAQYNQNRQQERIRLFETGLKFYRHGGKIEQEPVLSGLSTGRAYDETWAQPQRSVDFFDVKGDLETLLEFNGIDFRWKTATHPALHPGQTAQIIRNDQVLGTLGNLHPKIAKTLNLNGPVYLYELFLNLTSSGKVPVFKNISRFPEVRRDIAIIIDEVIPYAKVAQVIEECAGNWLVNHRIFDVYRGESVGTSKKSLAVAIVWRHPERTLREEEITEAFNNVIEELVSRLEASLRS